MEAKALARTTELLNQCAAICHRKDFNHRSLATKLKTSTSTFNLAVKVGLFTVESNGTYRPVKSLYDEQDSVLIYNYKRERYRGLKPIKNKPNPKPTHDAQYHIDALKALGYTGTIEKKQVISF